MIITAVTHNIIFITRDLGSSGARTVINCFTTSQHDNRTVIQDFIFRVLQDTCRGYYDLSLQQQGVVHNLGLQYWKN